jgi:hypothetical protein
VIKSRRDRAVFLIVHRHGRPANEIRLLLALPKPKTKDGDSVASRPAGEGTLASGGNIGRCRRHRRKHTQPGANGGGFRALSSFRWGQGGVGCVTRRWPPSSRTAWPQRWGAANAPHGGLNGSG